jgi:hypothetical protein
MKPKRGGRNLVVPFSSIVARQGPPDRRNPLRRGDARVLEAAPTHSTPKPLADLS